MQRIGGVFLNGAGLLVLLPVLLRESFQPIVQTLLHLEFSPLSLWLGIAFLGVILLPSYALVLLIQDLVQFYFTARTPGLEEPYFLPRFALSGIILPNDESRASREPISDFQSDASLVHFLLPYSDAQKRHLDALIQESEGTIILQSRAKVSKDLLQREHDRMYGSFGLAGVADRSLEQEVAKLEVSLVRHALHLRRLVLRYAKALLLLLWTTGVLILAGGTINSLVGANRPDACVWIVAVAFWVWAVAVPGVVRAPLRWIRLLDNLHRDYNVANSDGHLVAFERRTVVFALAMFMVSLWATTHLAAEVTPAAQRWLTWTGGGVLATAYLSFWLRRFPWPRNGLRERGAVH